MVRSRKSLRDLARLSGKPLSETITPSAVLATPTEEWVTSPDLTELGLPYPVEAVQNTTAFLMANPGLNSTVLFRADILYDSQAEEPLAQFAPEVVPVTAREIPGLELARTVVRRLIPRNSQLDRSLDQTCHFYATSSLSPRASGERFLIIYTPHVSSKEEIPYYHPFLRSIAFSYEVTPDSSSSSNLESIQEATDPGSSEKGPGIMSIHILPYKDEPIQPRLERTLTKLLEVQMRITRGRLNEASPSTTTPNQPSNAPLKDNLIPRSRVQDTYSRLKIKYAADLCARWVEVTEPSKHVYEDLGVAAFLIELWRDMYSCVPADETSETIQKEHGQENEKPTGDNGLNTGKEFTGFVDIACGNGALVYILLSEGYKGWGFDARRRKTWSIFPLSIQENLKEEIYIPKPFADILSPSPPTHSSSPPLSPNENSTLSESNFGLPPSLKTHTGSPPSFPTEVFIISNHADELTLWTPLLAKLLNPTSPPPFLAIPCCSHSLSGARYRFPPQHQQKHLQTHSPFSNDNNEPQQTHTESHQDQEDAEGSDSNENTNSKSGSLLALRQAKLNAQPHGPSFNKSTYGSLTDKLVLLSGEVGFEVTKTLLRIPSTRNIGVVGLGGSNTKTGTGTGTGDDSIGGEEVIDRVMEIVERECAREGGLYISAKTWVEKAKGLRKG
ncbi:hypothetical protein BJX70DRAFT_363513 [Aspergillus crustosus]